MVITRMLLDALVMAQYVSMSRYLDVSMSRGGDPGRVLRCPKPPRLVEGHTVWGSMG
jgi:hypothetical protein